MSLARRSGVAALLLALAVPGIAGAQMHLGAGAGALFSAVLGLGPALVVPGAILGVPAAIQALIRIESNTRRPQLQALAARLREMAEESAREG